eukprot:467104-Prymnesium_polylepis.1
MTEFSGQPNTSQLTRHWVTAHTRLPPPMVSILQPSPKSNPSATAPCAVASPPDPAFPTAHALN